MIRVNEYGVRDVIPDPDSDDYCAIRVFMEPDNEGSGNFFLLWWFDSYCASCSFEQRDDVSARFTRGTLIELRDEIQRVLDEDLNLAATDADGVGQ